MNLTMFIGASKHIQFSNSSDKSLGLYQDAQFRVGADSNSFQIADFTRSCNRWYYRAVLAAWQASSDWEFDDSNQTGFPISTATMVDSQADYAIPSNALKIHRVEVKDASGIWHLLQPIDETQVPIALDEYYKTDGIPLKYRVTRRSLILYPAPATASVTLASGLKLYFLREVDEFTTTDTTQEPGIEEPYHHVLSVGAAADFALAKGLENRKELREFAMETLDEMKQFYAGRHRDFKTRMRPKIFNYA